MIKEIDKKYLVAVGDFGMSRTLEGDYYNSSDKGVAVKVFLGFTIEDFSVECS